MGYVSSLEGNEIHLVLIVLFCFDKCLIQSIWHGGLYVEQPRDDVAKQLKHIKWVASPVRSKWRMDLKYKMETNYCTLRIMGSQIPGGLEIQTTLAKNTSFHPSFLEDPVILRVVKLDHFRYNKHIFETTSKNKVQSSEVSLGFPSQFQHPGDRWSFFGPQKISDPIWSYRN